MKELLNNIEALAKSVGKTILAERQKMMSSQVETKASKHDLVTHIDKLSEKLLLNGLSQLVPSAGFISEESNSEYKDGLNWIVDPIDGTTNFVHGIPHYAISIALAKGSELQLGLVYNIPQDECFTAYLNGGSFLNGKSIHVSPQLNFENTLWATGFAVSHSQKLDENLSVLKNLINDTRGIRRLGSAALDLAYVACGRLDAYYETHLHAWDVAAGALLVQEAGGQVSDFKNGSSFLFGDEILASNKNIHQKAISLMQNH